MPKVDKKKKQTYFDKAWLNDSSFSQWLKRGSNNTTYRCNVCPEKKNGERKLGDMAVGAVKKHAGTATHKEKLEQYLNTLSFFNPKSAASNIVNDVSQNAEVVPDDAADGNDVVVTSSSNVLPATSSGASLATTNPDPIPSLFKVQSSAKTEIVWALNCINQGYSDNSTQHFGETLRAMCPSSSEAQEFKMGPKKLMYVTNHGLYPYYKELLTGDLLQSPFLVILFDESLNEVLQKSEMDFFIRYWDDSAKKVQVRFFDSRFLGHTTHQDLLHNFDDALKGVDTSKILQVSMDGPNTNLRFFEELQKKRRADEMKEFIDIGTCNLHTVHGSLETGVTKSGWDLKKLLKGAHRILHDTPARRDDYFNITGSTKYPLPFVATRWVEDKVVGERLIELWPNMLKIFDFWEGLAKSKRPKSKSYANVLVHIPDKLIVAKLHFFVYVAGILLPYLTCYQGDGPMVPFIIEDIKKFYKGVLQIIVKPNILAKCKNSLDLVQLDLDDEALMSTKKIHLGFAAEDEIRKLLAEKKVENDAVMSLREEAKNFVVATCNKLAARNPLGFVIVRNAICFNPKSIVKETETVLQMKMKRLIMKLVSLKVIVFKTGDDAMSQYKDFLSNDVVQHKEKLLSFDRKSQRRLDDFFFLDMKVEDTYPDLALIMKIVFTLSHGQASVERGFNDNNVVLKKNQKGNTVVSRRFIKNYLSANKLLPHTAPITQPLVKSFRSAWRRYNQYLEDEREKEKKEKKNEELQQLENEVVALNTQSENLEDTIQSLNSQYHEFMTKAEEKNNMLFVVQGNALKRKSDEKAGLLVDLKKRILELEEKKKTFR